MRQLSAWDEAFTHEETQTILRDLTSGHLSSITDRQLASEIQDVVDGGRWAELCNWSVDYSGKYNTADLAELRQVLGFYQKLETLNLGVDKEDVARKAFQLSEEKCRETNQLLHGLLSRPEFEFHLLPGVSSILHAAQRKIASVLGPVPSISQLDLSFGPGATSTVPKRNACSRIKLSTVPSCSTNVLPLLPSFFREVPHWSALHNVGVSIDEDGWVIERVNVCISHGKLAFVPKNAKTYRSILTEPTVNAVLQAGYGKWIAKRLLRVGQDIKDQSRNQRLAREGSLTGALATLDLSSASDSIASELVHHLLPYDWYSALSECRTPSYIEKDGDEPKKLEKFSSMGNGFTFPLQTLIFWALVRSCQESATAVVSVYGDDIICPTACVPLVKKVFDAVGFTLNMSKSYWDGGFRESCGADYYFGVGIRPFYLKHDLTMESLFILHNFYKRSMQDERAARVLEYIPMHLRLWGPDGYGDGHLVGDWIPRFHKREDGWGGFLFDTYIKKGRKHSRLLPGDRVLPLYTVMVSQAAVIPSPPLKTFPYNFQYTRERGMGVGASYLSEDIQECSLPKGRDRKTGVTFDTLPGVKGYKRVSIYTLGR
nr:MAG: RNA dependent RNA polymerase [Leviviridae sp.]